MDNITKAQRSFVMSRIKSKNTTPEIVFRKLLHSAGFRYRLHDPKLPGKPDLVLKRYKTVVFIHGCFWHKHQNCPRRNITPKDNAAYWQAKQSRNAARDAANAAKLEGMGWRVFTVWECELKQPKEQLERFKRFVNDEAAASSANLYYPADADTLTLTAADAEPGYAEDADEKIDEREILVTEMKRR
ncbi:MAG: very short patch repair endonuclease [Treponema sp.]|jgi:DNA mismatch endonuclease (patch repair protein)|nr:very short patch repair endonuclease [Treponema sp.]